MHLPRALTATGLLLAGATLAMNAQAIEYPLGAPQKHAGMEISAVYLQPVTMEPAGMMKQPAQSDIHLETDIHALANNPNGFEEGAWMPYLVVSYTLTKVGTTNRLSGELMPMVANDGPHYGENIKLFGPGKYHVRFTIAPPTSNPAAHFGRHTDRLTGVQAWFKPFTVDYDFTFVGIGKKGGY